MQWANLQWQSSQNPQMVLPWLALAQKELQHLNDPALAVLSEALAQDQRSLSALSNTGPQVIWTQINAVLAMLQSTETTHIPYASAHANTSTTANAHTTANASAITSTSTAAGARALGLYASLFSDIIFVL